MNDTRKNAYRYLLYHFFLTIRTVPTTVQPAWSSTQFMLHSYYAGAVGYLFHNLALAAATDFVSFNEESFWAGVDQFSANNPTIDLSDYQRTFASKLAELEQ